MLIYVNMEDVRDLPLSLKLLASEDYQVRIGKWNVGRILADMAPSAVPVWTWTITGPYVPPSLQPAYGREHSLTAAKTALRGKFDCWKEWAADQRGAVAWYR